MSDDKKNPSRSRTRTRDQVQADYDGITQQPVLSAKEKALKEANDVLLRKSMAEITADKMSQDLAKAQVTIQKTLSSLNEELLEKLHALDVVKQNIKIEVEELTRIYGVDTVMSHLDLVIAQHDERKQELFNEMVATKTKWVEEQALHQKQIADRDLEVQKQRTREQDAYSYKTIQERKTAQDQFVEEMRVQQATERDRKEKLEKEWAAREEALKLAEKELTDLKAAVAAHQVEIDKAVKSAIAMTTNSITREHEHKLALVQKDAESERALFASEKKALNESLEREKQLSTALRMELTEANKKNSEIATKALDSTSSRELAASLQATLKDQSNGGSTKRA